MIGNKYYKYYQKNLISHSNIIFKSIYLIFSYLQPMSDFDSISQYFSLDDSQSRIEEDHTDQFNFKGELLKFPSSQSEPQNLILNERSTEQIDPQNIQNDDQIKPIYQNSDFWFDDFAFLSQEQKISSQLSQLDQIDELDNSIVQQSQNSTHQSNQNHSEEANKKKKMYNPYKNCKNQCKRHFLNLLRQAMLQEYGSHKYYDNFVKTDKIMKAIVYQVKNGKAVQKKSGNELQIKLMLSHQKLQQFWAKIRQDQAIDMQIMGAKYGDYEYKMRLLKLCKEYMLNFCK